MQAVRSFPHRSQKYSYSMPPHRHVGSHPALCAPVHKDYESLPAPDVQTNPCPTVHESSERLEILPYCIQETLPGTVLFPSGIHNTGSYRLQVYSVHRSEDAALYLPTCRISCLRAETALHSPVPEGSVRTESSYPPVPDPVFHRQEYPAPEHKFQDTSFVSVQIYSSETMSPPPKVSYYLLILQSFDTVRQPRHICTQKYASDLPALSPKISPASNDCPLLFLIQ